jgi:predicted ATP-dependent endonuclease of OLD family
MLIKKIEIHYFRSIEKSSIDFNSLLAIVGENNSGKSSLLRALNVFFNPEQELDSFKSGAHAYSANSIPKIDIHFKELPKKMYPRKDLIGRPIIVRCFYNKKKNIINYQYKFRNKFQALSNSFLPDLKKEVQFILIPAIRNYKQTLTNSSDDENTLLRRLLLQYLSKYTDKRDTLTPKVVGAINYLQKHALKKVSGDLKEAYSLNHSFDFRISHSKEIDYKLLLEDLTLNAIEGKKEFKLIDFGSGIQSLVNIALYAYLASLKKSEIILGIEEPEINLHPQAQKEFIATIRAATKKDELRAIFTTHSTTLVDQLNHENIILCRKVGDKRRSFKSVVYQIPQNFWDLHNIKQKKYYKFYSYRNSEFLFSDFVIVAESSVDAEVIKELMRQKKMDLDLQGVSILNLEGMKNLKYPFFLLKYFKIPYLLVLDKDFFLQYSDDRADDSRWGSGFFKYKKEFSNTNLISELVPSQNDRSELLKLLHENHSRAMDLLEKYNIICFKFNLEMDLIASRVAQNRFYSILKIPERDRNTKNLLVNYKKKIKDLVILLYVVEGMPHKNLPNSYKRIKGYLENKIKDNFVRGEPQ